MLLCSVACRTYVTSMLCLSVTLWIVIT